MFSWIHIFLSTHFVLFLSFFVLYLKCCHSMDERYEEQLLIKPLPSGNVYSMFQFTIKKDVGDDYDSAFHHYRVFPRSLGEILYNYKVHELHFSLTQGRWRYEKWGYPKRSAPPGAEIWAYFKGNVSEVSSNWKKLTNILSGQFCASLNFIDETNSVTPKFSFRPSGSIPSDKSFDRRFVRYSSLPSENLCTENLTPFKKLLPCSSGLGLSSLLNALNLFSAPYVSLAVDVQMSCKNDYCSSAEVQLFNRVSVVFDPLGFPGGKKDWSFVKLFGSSVSSQCPLAAISEVFVEDSHVEKDFKLSPKPTIKAVATTGNPEEDEPIPVYDLKQYFKQNSLLNVAAEYQKAHVYGILPPPPFYADRKITGYGQQNGGVLCTFYNNDPKRHLKILYFDVIPWFLRLYSHTLTIKSNNKTITPDRFFYKPAKDRQRPHHLELVLTLPPKSVTELSIEFDFAFLKWTEYPPDANHGFYAGSAVITTGMEFNKNLTIYPIVLNFGYADKYYFNLHTQILLVSLPTPDFSMPYNVICLTCTVVALAFGPIHNITTKSLYLQDDLDNESFMSKLKKKVKKWWKGSEEVKDATGQKCDEKES